MVSAKQVGIIGLGAGWDKRANVDELNKLATVTFRDVGDFIQWIIESC
jgi:hypothetical protein